MAKTINEIQLPQTISEIVNDVTSAIGLIPFDRVSSVHNHYGESNREGEFVVVGYEYSIPKYQKLQATATLSDNGILLLEHNSRDQGRSLGHFRIDSYTGHLFDAEKEHIAGGSFWRHGHHLALMTSESKVMYQRALMAVFLTGRLMYRLQEQFGIDLTVRDRETTLEGTSPEYFLFYMSHISGKCLEGMADVEFPRGGVP
jgi:hypothetical protein